jgi:hypothetical protein
MEEQIVSQALFGTISTVTFVGNTLVVILFIKKRHWLKNAHACLLLALAIQDIMTAVCLMVLPGFALPADYYDLPASPTLRTLYCTMLWSLYIPFALSIVSIYTCLMLAIDRLLAVWRPLTYKRFCGSRKTIVAMLILPWVAGLLAELGTALNAQSIKQENGSYVCKRTQIKRSLEHTMIALILFLAKGFVPAVLMSLAYGKMMITLKHASLRVSQNTTGAKNSVPRDQAKSYLALKRITRMACAASALVVSCWLPDQIYYCLFELDFIEMDNSLHNALHILAFLNTCFNPFLYSFSNKQYKDEFKKILCCALRRNMPSQSEASCTEQNKKEMHEI